MAREAHPRPTLERKVAGGTTAVTAILADNVLSLAWVGDSRAVLTQGFKALRVTREIATALGVHENTVARDIRLAEAWLVKQMKTDEIP